MEFTKADTETLARIFRWRRDVRHFKTTPVAEDVLDRLRHAMDTAPSVGNSRPWRVIRVNDPALRAGVRANFNLCNAEAATEYKDEQHRRISATETRRPRRRTGAAWPCSR